MKFLGRRDKNSKPGKKKEEIKDEAIQLATSKGKLD